MSTSLTSPSLTRARLALPLTLALGLLSGCAPDKGPAPGAPAAAAKPSLSVTLTPVQRSDWPVQVRGQGDVAAWQEVPLASEVSGLKLAQVLVEVGDTVRPGQVLARLDAATVRAERAATQATVAEARAALAQAELNAQRSQRLSPSGALSQQETVQYDTQLKTAQARLEAAQAQLALQDLRLAKTEVKAPDAGVIAARTAVPGAFVQAGTELFRLIRQGRLEWRAQVKGDALLSLKAGQRARVQLNGEELVGTVRQVAPTVDPQSRNGLVYVDLPAKARIKPGMHVSGTFELATQPALHVPQSALVSRDGYHYAFKVDEQGRVQAQQVQTGRLQGDRVEVVEGLAAHERIVSKGAGFLKSGDLVRVVSEDSAGPASAPSAPSER